MNRLEKVIYTARVQTTGGRDGGARSDDGNLDVKLASPGTSGQGTNPEQMFAAGYSACFISALKAVAPDVGVDAVNDVSIDAEVDLGPASGGYGLAVRFKVHLPGMDREMAEKLLDAADKACPYSNATRGNIDVEISLADSG